MKATNRALRAEMIGIWATVSIKCLLLGKTHRHLMTLISPKHTFPVVRLQPYTKTYPRARPLGFATASANGPSA